MSSKIDNVKLELTALLSKNPPDFGKILSLSN